MQKLMRFLPENLEVTQVDTLLLRTPKKRVGYTNLASFSIFICEIRNVTKWRFFFFHLLNLATFQLKNTQMAIKIDKWRYIS